MEARDLAKQNSREVFSGRADDLDKGSKARDHMESMLEKQQQQGSRHVEKGCSEGRGWQGRLGRSQECVHGPLLEDHYKDFGFSPEGNGVTLQGLEKMVSISLML